MGHVAGVNKVDWLIDVLDLLSSSPVTSHAEDMNVTDIRTDGRQ